jgi:hypothetical protein
MQKPTSDNYFVVLRTCILSALVLMIAATAFKLPSWIGMVGGGLPLLYYHLGYLSPRAKKGLSQSAIDSVYYFGFLVTISALGVSAVTLALSGGNEPLSNVAFQFGLGLLATGYAVVARMHLSSISTMVDEASPEAVLDQYIHRSREMVINVEMASTQFVELANNLMLKSQEVAEAARLTTEKTMLETARRFDEELRGTLASARQGLTEIRGLVTETAFVEEREALVKSVRSTLDSVAALNKALDEFAQRTTEGARSSQTTTATSQALNDSLISFHSKVLELGGESGALVVSTKSLNEAGAALVAGTHIISDAVSELGGMAGTLSGLGVTFKNIKTLTSKANEQLEALVNSSGRLDEATRHISNSVSATSAFADAVDRTVTSLPALQAKAVSLGSDLSELSSTVKMLDSHLERIPKVTGEIAGVSAQLQTSLHAVSDILGTAKVNAQELAEHSVINVKSLEQEQRLAQQNVDALRSTSETVNTLLGKLATTVERVQGTLDSSTGSLRTSIETATTSLEKDVKRSSDVARLFSERLTDVAQIIIDNTRADRKRL